MSPLLLVAFFALVMAGIAGAGYLILREREPEAAAALHEPAVGGGLAAALYDVGQILPAGRETEPLRRQLFRAGYRSPSAVNMFVGIRASTAAILGVLVLWAVGVSKGSLAEAFLPAICAAGFGFMLPSRVLEWQTRARAGRIRRAIPPALDLMTLAIEAGQSLEQAMNDTARNLREVYPDLCDELTFCHLEMRAGKSRAEALRHLARRSPEEELGKFAALLIDGDRFGTSLGPALRTHARFLRQHLRFKAQESARKLTVKLVLPVFFLIFPSVMLVTLGPAYLQMQMFFEQFLK